MGKATVDESHRINEKAAMYLNMGENQVKKIIHESACSIFFIDEQQWVTMKDTVTKEEIKKWARDQGVIFHTYELPSQFQYNESYRYLAFLDQALKIRETSNVSLTELDYNFRVVDNPMRSTA